MPTAAWWRITPQGRSPAARGKTDYTFKRPIKAVYIRKLVSFIDTLKAMK
jgi:hypothetical protein